MAEVHQSNRRQTFRMNCYCAMCEKVFIYELDKEEISALMKVCKQPLTDLGELKLACDTCQPLVYSARRS